VLRQCGQFGPDHRTNFNATPLMLAAQCGNVALVEALLERGADPLVYDRSASSLAQPRRCVRSRRFLRLLGQRR